MDDRTHADEWSVPVDLPGASITFPQGLVGCDQWRRFVLRTDDVATGLFQLTSLDEPRVQFLLLNPDRIDPTYQPELTAAELAELRLEHPADALVLCIVTTRTPPDQITVNLAGPLIINPTTELGLQLLQVNAAYSTRHPVSGTDGFVVEP